MTCPLCGGDAERRTQAPSPDAPEGPAYTLFRCPACAVAFVHPQPGPEAQSYPAGYYGRRGSLPRWGGRLLSGSKCRRIERLKAGGRLLDFGCGRGEFLDAMRRRGWEVRGVEASEGARSLLPPELRGAVHPDPGPLSAERFDVITLWHVLEHLPRPAETLRSLRDLLGEGGILYVAVPNFSSWESAAAGAAWFHLDLPRHLFHFEPEGLVRLLEREGFEPIRVDHSSWAYNVFGLCQTWLNRITGTRNVLYRRLKGQDGGAWSLALGISLLLAPFLAGFAFPACLVLGLKGRAGTMEIALRRGGGPFPRAGAGRDVEGGPALRA